MLHHLALKPGTAPWLFLLAGLSLPRALAWLWTIYAWIRVHDK